MVNVAAVIDDVARRIDAHRASVKAVMEGAGGPANPIIAAAGGSSQSMLGYGQRQARHTEQYNHNVGWTFTAIQRIATRLSGQPIHVGRKLPPDTSRHVRQWTKRHGFERVNAEWEGRFGRRLLGPVDRARAPDHVKDAHHEYELIEDHEVLKVLADPNEIMVAASLFYVTVASLELTGLAYWWWERRDGRLRVHHLPVDWVTPRHTDEKLYAWYEVKPPNRMGDSIPIPADEITRFCLPDPSDPHKAISPAQTQAPAIDADESMQVAQARQFHNDMYPGLLIHVGRHEGIDGKLGERQHLTRSQRKDLVEAVRAVYEDMVNYREPLILDGLIEKVSRMTYTPAEMDYLKSGQVTKGRIMQAFGVNPFLSGENVTIGYAQASVAEDVFLSMVINPLGVLIGQHITKHPRLKQQGYELWIEEAVARNPDLRLKKWTLALNNKAGPMVDEEEFRQDQLNLPPREHEEDEGEPADDGAGGSSGDDDRAGQAALPAPQEKGG